MSLSKARDLRRLAETVAARHMDVSLVEISDEFGANHCTAQRMTKALEDVFQNVEVITDEDRRRGRKLRKSSLQRLKSLSLGDGELAALDMSIKQAEREEATHEIKMGISLLDSLLAFMPSPRVRGEPLVLETIAQALKEPFVLVISYAGPNYNESRERVLEPYGPLLGARGYLAGREQGRAGRLQHFRLDRIAKVGVGAQSYVRDPEFDLNVRSACTFGCNHPDAEYGEVIWRFHPAAAAAVREFVLHPQQQLIAEDEGRLTVRFKAGVWLEMAWHFYVWSDQVEVLESPDLAALVAAHRRADFPAMP